MGDIVMPLVLGVRRRNARMDGRYRSLGLLDNRLPDAREFIVSSEQYPSGRSFSIGRL